MKAIQKYQAFDGVELADADKCLDYEALCLEIHALMTPWADVTIAGAEFVQQDKYVIIPIQRAMVDIFERLHWKDHHTEWARNADIPAGMSLIGRYVDDSGFNPERRVWGRIQRLDQNFREYEQPYYAIQADKRSTSAKEVK